MNRTRPAERRKQGKTDRLDAYRAARSVLSGEATTDPKRASIEPLRALTVARSSALKAQHATWRQIGALLVNAPAAVRDRYRDLPHVELVATLANTRPEQLHDADGADTLFALRSLARRYRDLGQENVDLEQRMLARATATNPGLLAIKGHRPGHRRPTADHRRGAPRPAAVLGFVRRVGRHGAHPGQLRRTDRHRLCRGGDRQANAALHHIVKNRMTNDPRTPRLPRRPPGQRMDHQGRLSGPQPRSRP